MRTVAAIWDRIVDAADWGTDRLFGPMVRLKEENPKKADRIAITIMVLLSLFIVLQLWLMGPEEAARFAHRPLFK